MRKRLFTLTLALVMALTLLPTSAFAAEWTVTEVVPMGKYQEIDGIMSDGLVRVRSNDFLFGFVNEWGQEVVPCKYHNADRFSEGFAVVTSRVGDEGRSGFIDTTGTEVIPCRYRSASNFHEGLARVKLGDGLLANGFIDPTGKEVISGPFRNAGDFKNGYAYVEIRDEETGERYCAYIDKTGKEIISDKKYLLSDVGLTFSEGLSVVSTHDFKYGYIDESGQEVIPCIYDAAYDFHNGLAVAHIRESENREADYLYIDKTGKEVFSIRYTEAAPFDDSGYARVSVPPSVAREFGAEGGLVMVKNRAKMIVCYMTIDKTGKAAVLPGRYTDIAERSGDGLLAVGDGNYSYAFSGSLSYESTTVNEESDMEYGYVDPTTGEVVIPLQYDKVKPFSNGVAQVGIRTELRDTSLGAYGSGLIVRLWGLIDRTGKEIIPCKYHSMSDFSGGFAQVGIRENEAGSTKMLYGLIDESGKECIPPKYASLRTDKNTLDSGLIAVMDENEKWGVLSLRGEMVIPCQYDSLTILSGSTVVASMNGADEFAPAKQSLLRVEKQAVPTATPSTQTVNVDGENVEFAMYALNGGSVNYIRVRDLAAIFNGTPAQFNVGWNGNVTLTSKTAYDGTTDKAPFTTEMAYTEYTAPTFVDGKAVNLEAIQIQYSGGGFTYYKLRDVAQALDFNVGWSADKGVYVETNKPYDPNN